MGVEYRVWYDGEFIRVEHAPGFRIASELLEAVWREISETCRLHHCRRVFVEGEAPRRELRPIEALDSAAEAASRVPQLVLAICLKDYVTDPTTNLFIKALARRGCKAQFFTESQEARDWLRASDCDAEAPAMSQHPRSD